ncbi:dihydropteroate synthase [Saonia flava]|uniref:Dihydropteroate synthase n=1 Tax=Saonia flava TaxID=523696 RepID=A0A846R0T1_9FLAO|nr:dihydropteroate synthase [Saonia flava]NJB72562.1 dihydropteroate synthase [Saonia flava]
MTVNCKGKLIDLKSPKIMGILNLTPDSFFDGGKYREKNIILNRVEKMLQEGATFVDVGAYSSRPGAIYVSEEEELNRIVPIIDLLLKQFPDILLSIDTFRSTIADACLEKGAAIINDISAGNLDDKMLQIIAKHQVPYIMMHMRGTPQTMQQQAVYENLLEDILFYFSQKIAIARSLGINDIIVDPGFGFAKTTEQNYELLQKLDLFQILELPVLVGLSRKSMIYKVLGGTGKEALNGTTALNMFSLNKGANILRVHDVKEAKECVALFNELYPNE